MGRRVRLNLTEIEARAVWAALDADIAMRTEAARNEFGERIPGEEIADDVPAQKRALKKVIAALAPTTEEERDE